MSMSNIRRKLILVDDSKFSLAMSAQKLQNVYDVTLADSADELFKKLEFVQPDVILLDINMPDVDGYETIAKLKADSRYAPIPVIFLTAKQDEDSIVYGMYLGAADHITKPFSTFHLQERIERLLQPDYHPHQDLLKEVSLQNERHVGKPCVLAVDDVPHMLRSIQYALRGRFNVYTLLKPELLEEFLQKIKVTPDLFLLDFNMPVLDGYDLFLKIRDLPDHKETPIIFLTAEGTITNVTAAINLGASDFIVKPFDSVTLREKIAKHIFRSRVF